MLIGPRGFHRRVSRDSSFFDDNSDVLGPSEINY